ncbi:MAG TPA: hypothetical protein VKT51_04030 [Candidatus Eremiobacteraceae bacterium]|nr:hypothetical protein [Candidatus Eremiobacteraceae bacterium]
MTSDALSALVPTIEKLGFTVEFIERNIIAREGPVTVSEIAMLWQGMPNKHDRKRTRQLLDALTETGLLKVVDAESGVFARVDVSA